ncbi:branched-chain amino acid ABC transporter permease [Nocardioides sp. zg-536]|uniref:Branched-chain amino acid ABC transporter permease n=1 Tax=Nocardioides faecalis TaxID=2803858 RepID=A0A939BWL3_9ACTN|nr:branched-chain amino acid ABC transporter permease [Nocardioides faecalis]MBM9458488.1 branched-chain amino acid ABC transporter permease [Nocardioides faecalis]MBS4752819.1 branched-chain amino acid ABC transporter permease [Nocardioides faecalis]QVI58500.1 branched-chain amino acid ABC transporter permease [Nocardioides faecalis]
MSILTSWGRPELYTSYRQDTALLNTRSKMLGAAAVLVVAALVPLMVADNLLIILAGGLVLAIGAIGLNLVTGYAGQVSLGHAFFVGVGAYTAAVMAGEEDGRYLGLGIDFMPAWLLGAGAVAALFGAVVAPLATRLRGLYLAVVTLGLVFIGQYFFFELDSVTGGPQVGREAASPELFGIQFTVDNGWQGGWTEEQKLYWLFLAVLVVLGVLARNIARSRIGRAFSAIRDRDVAAGVMGVDLTRYKVIAFTISSFYAGVAGALMFSASGHFTPESFGLLMSVQFIAIVLIGGVATISGTIMGAMLIALLPRVASELPAFVPFLSSSASEHPNVFEFEQVMYGVLIVAFLLFEPRGLFGIWHRIRTYWKSFPFSY